MKTILSIFAFSFSVHCFADSISLVCDGVTQAPQSLIQSGKMEITVAGDTVENEHHEWFFNEGYTYSVSFGDSVLQAPGVTCGQPMGDAGCNLQRNGPNLPFSVFQACGVGAFDTRGLPHQKFSSRLTLAIDHGFFYCAAHDTNPVIAKHIELSNCHPK